MRLSIFPFAAPLLFLTLTACPPSGELASTPPPQELLNDSTWRIVSIDGAPIASERPAEMRFDGASLSGSAGCNRFSGAYKVVADKLTTTQPIASTMMACFGAVGEQEQALLALLSDTVTLRVDEQGRLMMNGRSHQAVLEPQPAGTL
ncbi:MAG: META domain-containing protein [Pseudomonadota bacterium]